LRQLQAVRLVFGGRVQFAPHVTPHFGVRLNVAPQARQERRRHMAIPAARLNAEYIGVMHALRELLEGLLHLVAGGAEPIGFSQFQGAKEAARKADADDKSNQPSGRNPKQEPALRPPPQPGGKTAVHRLRRIQFEPLDAAMSNLSSQSVGPIYELGGGSRAATKYYS